MGQHPNPLQSELTRHVNKRKTEVEVLHRRHILHRFRRSNRGFSNFEILMDWNNRWESQHGAAVIAAPSPAAPPLHASRFGAWLLAFNILVLTLGGFVTAQASGGPAAEAGAFPPPLESYDDADLTGVGAILKNRIQKQPFNLWATVLFFCAVVHTFFTQRFRHIAHVLEERHRENKPRRGNKVLHVSMSSRVFHFLGEVEAVFGIWLIPLFVVMGWMVGVKEAVAYVDTRVSFAEPVFVVVIMFMASTRPVLQLAEQCMRWVAKLGGGGPVAWWFAILTLGPLLGSLITEPAAMTISASLLGRQFYLRKPRLRFAYATLGLLFVNISVGGTLTHFAAPPVLMVAAPWGWTTPFMIQHFGWIALIGIVLSNLLYYQIFRKDFSTLVASTSSEGDTPSERDPIPVWVTVGHLVFMGGAVLAAHHPPLTILCLLFFIAFYEVTEDYQNAFSLRSPVLVGFFLAGLVIHGGLQQWWIAPVLGSLNEIPLMFGAIALTAFNDNAAITYLATLVPTMTEGMKFAVVAGAVSGGGLTVIANAPNPAGQSILNKHFPEGISPGGLLLGALVPTLIMTFCFILLR